MRVYLSSYRLGEDPSPLRRQTKGRAGVVLNALDEFGPSRDRSLGREMADLDALGYVCEELDLRQYFSQHDVLTARLRQMDLVWIVGGNSFVLARAMTLAGFRGALAYVDPGFVYAGYSAGACVAGPDLDGLEIIDNPAALPDGYPADAPAAALNLVPFHIVPHWRSDHPEAAGAEQVAAVLAAAGRDYRCLRDGEAVIVEVPAT